MFAELIIERIRNDHLDNRMVIDKSMYHGDQRQPIYQQLRLYYTFVSDGNKTKHRGRIIPLDNIKFLGNVCIANLTFSSFLRPMLCESTIQGTNTC